MSVKLDVYEGGPPFVVARCQPKPGEKIVWEQISNSNNTAPNSKNDDVTAITKASDIDDTDDTAGTVNQTGNHSHGFIVSALSKIRSFFSTGSSANTNVTVSDAQEPEPKTIIGKTNDLRRQIWKFFVHLPDCASDNTTIGLASIFLCLTFLTLAVSLGPLYTIKLASPSAGVKANRDFLWVTLTYYEAIWWLSLLGTMKFVTPDKIFTRSKRAAIFIAVLIFQKYKDWQYCQIRPHYAANFPIPFSMARSAQEPFLLMCIFFFVLNMPWFRKGVLMNKLIVRDVKRSLMLIVVIGAAQMAFVGWGMAMHRMRGERFYQMLVGLTLPLLRFFFKNFLMKHVTLDWMKRRFVMLNFIIDVQAISIQVATTPFIESPLAFAMLILVECTSLALATSSGIDRIALLAKSVFLHNRETILVKHNFDKGKNGFADFKERAKGILFEASVKKISWCYIRGQEDVFFRRRGWMDRAIFNFVDQITVKVVSCMVRMSSLLCVYILRNSANTKDNLNGIFSPSSLSDDEWKKANIYGVIAILVLVVSVYLSSFRLYVLSGYSSLCCGGMSCPVQILFTCLTNLSMLVSLLLS